MKISLLIVSLGAFLFVSCGPTQPVMAPSRAPKAQEVVEENYNPYPAGSYERFIASSNYPKTSKTYRNEALLAETNEDNSKIVISISKQRAFLMNGDEVAMDYAVSTGKSSHPTPAGSYKIREMIENKRSNMYGRIYDADGEVVNKSAHGQNDEVPEGGEFVGAAMPYWMRLTWDGIGMHVGNVPRYPASHSCIRGHDDVVPVVFSKVKLLTPVIIED